MSIVGFWVSFYWGIAVWKHEYFSTMAECKAHVAAPGRLDGWCSQ